MSASAQWSDLRARVISAFLMALVGAFAVWQGGLLYVELVSVICGLMVWETARMFQARQAIALGVAAAVVLNVIHFLPGVFVAPLLIAMALVAAGQAEKDKPVLFAVIAWVLFGSFALMHLRTAAGTGWILWLVFIVVASDVAGYFAGRSLGGPKFWPKISPKKTWSGTIAGWLGAALVGVAFIGTLGATGALVFISILVGFAGQMGDIAQSAVKRRQGVKDSSDLIPGHGGVFDRFDAMLGAGVLTILLWALGLLPGAGA
ncbi:phosphatidate cytidylyltransferase [Roseovarius phycicola]|uniref:Phosphatidate cytidylyltransferase n=1 Tax=Roseovarius phycicola TaxID=3080976 RepID=A0ABZ2HC51_9RHOB